MENKWRAARYGLDGKLIDFGKQKEVPARDLMHEYLEFVDDVVDELGSREEVNYIHKILEHGTGADRQLRVFQETGDLKKVVDYIIEETEAGLAEDEEPATVRRSRLMNDFCQAQPHSTRMHTPFDPEFTPGAHNAVNVCLRVQPDERVSVITDEATAGDRCGDRGAKLRRSARLTKLGAGRTGAASADRSCRGNSGRYGDQPGFSIFAVQVQRNELRSRMQMTDMVNRRKMRHAHMVNINRQIMLEGMRADFAEVDRLSQKVVEMVRKATKIRATTAAGTDLVADLNPNYKWLKTSGIISSGQMGQSAGRRNLHDAGRSRTARL